MRSYGKRFLKNDMRRAADATAETRDGIIIDIDNVNRWCRVKIQGSEEFVVAHYPENTNNQPEWMQPGNAVRLCHKGGVRGKVEVIGRGQTIPTGLNTKPPNPVIPVDCIMDGCEIFLPDAHRDAFGAGWGIIWIRTGTYRGNGMVKALRPIPCRKSNPLKMINRPVVGRVVDQFVVKMPPPELWAYCRFMINPQSGKVEMISSGNKTEPALPEVPEGKLDLGWVLLQGGQTSIDEWYINAYWQRPAATYILIDSPFYLEWGTTVAMVTVTVYDQFSRPIAGQWSAAVSITKGTGFVGTSEAGALTRAITVYAQGKATLAFVYRRNTIGVEISPTIRIAINEMAGHVDELYISLVNQNGDYL